MAWSVTLRVLEPELRAGATAPQFVIEGERVEFVLHNTIGEQAARSANVRAWDEPPMLWIAGSRVVGPLRGDARNPLRIVYRFSYPGFKDLNFLGQPATRVPQLERRMSMGANADAPDAHAQPLFDALDLSMRIEVVSHDDPLARALQQRRDQRQQLRERVRTATAGSDSASGQRSAQIAQVEGHARWQARQASAWLESLVTQAAADQRRWLVGDVNAQPGLVVMRSNRDDPRSAHTLSDEQLASMEDEAVAEYLMRLNAAVRVTPLLDLRPGAAPSLLGVPARYRAYPAAGIVDFRPELQRHTASAQVEREYTEHNRLTFLADDLLYVRLPHRSAALMRARDVRRECDGDEIEAIVDFILVDVVIGSVPIEGWILGALRRLAIPAASALLRVIVRASTFLRRPGGAQAALEAFLRVTSRAERTLPSLARSRGVLPSAARIVPAAPTPPVGGGPATLLGEAEVTAASTVARAGSPAVAAAAPRVAPRLALAGAGPPRAMAQYIELELEPQVMSLAQRLNLEPTLDSRIPPGEVLEDVMARFLETLPSGSTPARAAAERSLLVTLRNYTLHFDGSAYQLERALQAMLTRMKVAGTPGQIATEASELFIRGLQGLDPSRVTAGHMIDSFVRATRREGPNPAQAMADRLVTSSVPARSVRSPLPLPRAGAATVAHQRVQAAARGLPVDSMTVGSVNARGVLGAATEARVAAPLPALGRAARHEREFDVRVGRLIPLRDDVRIAVQRTSRLVHYADVIEQALHGPRWGEISQRIASLQASFGSTNVLARRGAINNLKGLLQEAVAAQLPWHERRFARARLVLERINATLPPADRFGEVLFTCDVTGNQRALTDGVFYARSADGTRALILDIYEAKSRRNWVDLYRGDGGQIRRDIRRLLTEDISIAGNVFRRDNGSLRLLTDYGVPQNWTIAVPRALESSNANLLLTRVREAAAGQGIASRFTVESSALPDEEAKQLAEVMLRQASRNRRSGRVD